MNVSAPSENEVAARKVNQPSRRPDLDVLRVLCIILLVIFHSAMPFNAYWDWFVVDKNRSEELLEFSFFVSRWRMALLYTIAGIGTWFALRNRTPKQYLKGRSRRLLWPIALAVFVLVPPQVAAERLQEGVHYNSVWDFLRSYSDLRAYPDGNWTWHHLWFVAYLFVYSVILLPLFVWLRDRAPRSVHQRIEHFFASDRIYLLAIPMALFYAFLIQQFHGPPDIFRDMAMFLVYGCTFLYGYLIADNPMVWEGIVKRRWISLILAFLLFAYVNYHRWHKLEPPPGYYPASLAYEACLGAMPWYFTMGILGFGRKYIVSAPKWLHYGNEAAYPVYVLHQTIVVGLAFFLVQTPLHVHLKFVILATLSLALTGGTYHFLVRPFPRVRYLFGMNPLKK